jgi:uncharacterized protein involved in exopolysaccharide biosynthesis
LESPPNDWLEGPGLIESVRRYKWLVVAAAVIGGIMAFVWSSTQPVRYQGVVRVFLETGGDPAVDPDRIVSSQAQYLTSPEVLNRTVALIDGRLTRKELEERLTVEPAEDADLITIRVLDATPQQAATLADTVARAYREVVARQANDAARQEVAALRRRQQQLAREIATLTEQLASQSGDPTLKADRDAKSKEIIAAAEQREAIRRDAARASRVETLRETAVIPDEPAQPKPLRTAAIGALLALVAAGALAWWLNGRQPAADGQGLPGLRPSGGGADRDELEQVAGIRRAARRPDGRVPSTNGSPAANGSVSGIADFDQVATSIQQLFRSLDGPPLKLYEENLPRLVVEQIAQSFPVDLVVILLKTDDGVRTMGSVGPKKVSKDVLDHAAWDLIEDAATSGPRLVYLDEMRSLAGSGLEREEDVSLALVPLVRDQVGFGVLLAGRRQNGDGDTSQLGDEEVEQIAAATYDMVPYLWAWLLVRSLKLRLGRFQ